MRVFLGWAKNSSFLRDVSVLAFGRIVGQAALLLAMPVLTRLYTPDDFGLAGAIVALASVIYAVSALRIDQAIVLPRSRTASINMFVFSLASSSVFAFLTLISIALYALATGERGETLALYAIFLPLLVMSNAFAQAVTEIGLKFGRYTTIGVFYVVRSLTNVAVQAGLVVLGAGAVGLLSGYVLGALAFFAGCLAFSLPALRSTTRVIDRRVMAACLRRYSSFIKFNTPQTLIASAASQLPILMMGAFFSPAVAGAWFLVVRALSGPSGLIVDTAAKGFVVRAAAIHNAGRQLRREFALATVGLACLGALPALILFFFAVPLVTLVFGDQWVLAGQFMAAFAPAWLASVVVMPASAMVRIYGKHKIGLIWTTLTFLARMAALLAAAILVQDPLVMVWALSIVNVVFSGAFVAYGWRLSSQKKTALRGQV